MAFSKTLWLIISSQVNFRLMAEYNIPPDKTAFEIYKQWS